MALTITFFTCRLFLYCSYNMWRLMHCRNIVSEFWLFVDFFRYTKHLHLMAPLVPKSVTSYSIWPLASYLFRWFLRSQPFFTRDASLFTRDAYCITRLATAFCASFRLSVRRSLVKCVLGVARSLCGSWASCFTLQCCVHTHSVTFVSFYFDIQDVGNKIHPCLLVKLWFHVKINF